MNGSYRMVLKGVDEIDWFTDGPDRVEGTWKPQKLLRKWDKYFASSEPNAQATVEVGEQRELFTFEMFKPKMKSGKIIFNVKPLSNSSEDKVTGLQGKDMSDISLFIDDATPGVLPCFPYCSGADLKGLDMSGQDLVSDFSLTDFSPKVSPKGTIYSKLTSTNLEGAIIYEGNLSSANLTYANLNSANLNGANLTDSILYDAQLANAQLEGANLTGAYMYGANLYRANLTDANLSDAVLTGANLTDAVWGNTTCPDGTINIGTSPCTTEQLNLA
jgi:hypothetical protein